MLPPCTVTSVWPQFQHNIPTFLFLEKICFFNVLSFMLMRVRVPPVQRNENTKRNGQKVSECNTSWANLAILWCYLSYWTNYKTTKRMSSVVDSRVYFIGQCKLYTYWFSIMYTGSFPGIWILLHDPWIRKQMIWPHFYVLLGVSPWQGWCMFTLFYLESNTRSHPLKFIWSCMHAPQ